MMARRIAWVALAVLAFAGPAMAAPVYGTDATLLGSRTYPTSFAAAGGYAVDGSEGVGPFEVSWIIDELGSGAFRYAYSFLGFRAPEISHVILDLTDDCVRLGDCLTNVEYPGGVKLQYAFFAPDSPGGSNPGLPATIGGVKFDETVGASGFSIAFESFRKPVWGDLYVKGGSDSYAYNTGLVDHLSDDVLDFIARPDGDGGGPGPEPVPEPGTLGLLGLGLAALRKFGRRRG